mgnify:CR=1 FL=1
MNISIYGLSLMVNLVFYPSGETHVTFDTPYEGTVYLL